jgi:hypothetical protein
MGPLAPPIPDDVFWPAWAEAEGYKGRACKLLGIGPARLAGYWLADPPVFQQTASAKAGRASVRGLW